MAKCPRAKDILEWQQEMAAELRDRCRSAKCKDKARKAATEAAKGILLASKGECKKAIKIANRLYDTIEDIEQAIDD
jgi:hypothetical protein